ncbi:hypothetical protein Bhyg_10835 [Pseudolycoriella hygida]|uniref:Uncharacterized protein n=1 Tax=Pseudolycoriella hygida TaxID=35572 RepID=A0A9Q0RZ22_9DIPT|nr:hypothetical protein Bhyg_10835 [Pseudolycoriella hygida]
MAKRISDDLNVLPQPLDPVASREERRATGRMVALMVALILILSVLYQAWIKKIAVLAGVTIPALIMILYGGWVLFLAKKDKQRRINAENHLRASRADSLALSEVTTLQVSNTTPDKVEVSKKGKAKTPKVKVENETTSKTVETELEMEMLPQISVHNFGSNGKLSRSLSTYN